MKNKIKILLISLCAAMVTLSGVLVPGITVSYKSNSSHNVVEQVPEKYYSASNMAIARNASASLTPEEKLQLVTGAWESNIYAASESEMNINAYKAVTFARAGIEKLYEEGKYPISISSTYNNWFNWETKEYKAVDKTFNTYTAYYFEITFEKYDRTETHTVRVTEDGIVFYAKAEWTDSSRAPFIYELHQ